MTTERLVLVSNSAGGMFRFRLPILLEARARGCDVVAVCGLGQASEASIRELRAHSIDVRIISGLEDPSVNPVALFRQIFALRKIFRELNPSIVHSFTHVANIVSCFALLGNKRPKFFPNLTGSGRLFVDHTTLAQSFTRRVLLLLYGKVAARASRFFFQNQEDAIEFREWLSLPEDLIEVTSGSGLDPSLIAGFKSSSSDVRRELNERFGVSTQRQLVLFPSRALKSKGVEDFYELGRQYSASNNDYVFIHAGSAVENSADGFSARQLGEIAGPNVFYIGFYERIYDLMREASIVVLPSTYREGVPRSLIEALYFKNAIITYDSVGCRDVVLHQWNGWLAQKGSVASMLQGILFLRDIDSSLIAERSRDYFEEHFHIRHITGAYMRAYGLDSMRGPEFSSSYSPALSVENNVRQ